MTDPVEFEQEENFPPSIESPTGMDVNHHLDEVIILDQDEPDDFDGELELDVIVRDPNVDQELLWQLYVVPGQRVDAGSWPGDGELERRQTVSMERGLFSQLGCRRIDLLVSSDFQFGNERQPSEPGDIATARWWVYTRSGPEELVNPSDCPGRM